MAKFAFDYDDLAVDLGKVMLPYAGSRFGGESDWQQFHSHNLYERDRFKILVSRKGELAIYVEGGSGAINVNDQRTRDIFEVLAVYMFQGGNPNAQTSPSHPRFRSGESDASGVQGSTWPRVVSPPLLPRTVGEGMESERGDEDDRDVPPSWGSRIIDIPGPDR